MEIITTAWIAVFFLFALTVFFVWSKIYVISRKLRHLAALLDEIEALAAPAASDAQTPGQDTTES